jgi:hypothetical protein
MITKTTNPTVSSDLMRTILQSIKQVDGYGSVEVYVQDHTVTQITVRSIRKTNTKLNSQALNNKKLLTNHSIYTKQNT